jgi:two-component system sensor histidine kinase UhpB
MSLRTRLLTAIFLALLISFSAGASVAVWQARHSVTAEQNAALDNAMQSLAAAVGNLQEGAGQAAELGRIVHAFDGSRHVQAEWVRADGAVAVTSRPAPAPPTPDWLMALIAPKLKPMVLSVAGGAARLRLQSAPLNEAAERWAELRGRIAGFAFFFAAASILCSVIAARALRPLTVLAQGMALVGRGETALAVAAAGPPEIAGLARAFNAMAVSLRDAETRARRLERQIATIAEEERAEIARDLHDEVGPLLFAITTYAASIGRQMQIGETAPVPGQLDAIRQAVAQLQLQVRDMLGRLTPSGAEPADLAAALAGLVGFWRGIRPQTRFTLTVDAALGGLPEAGRDCLFRAAQEGISNAVRHGDAQHIEVTTTRLDGAIVLRVSDDGTGGAELAGGLGLAGMRARAASLGGMVEIRRPSGWEVSVHLPDRTHAPSGAMSCAS